MSSLIAADFAYIEAKIAQISLQKLCEALSGNTCVLYHFSSDFKAIKKGPKVYLLDDELQRA
jgi:hypothetical protein